jgi:hypothetical protein
MIVSHTDYMGLFALAIEQEIGYETASHELYKLSKLFKNAFLLLERGVLYEEVNKLRDKVTSEYGEVYVTEQINSVRNHVDHEAHLANMSPCASMWLAVALAFAHHPVDNCTDGKGRVCSFGNDI